MLCGIYCQGPEQMVPTKTASRSGRAALLFLYPVEGKGGSSALGSVTPGLPWQGLQRIPALDSKPQEAFVGRVLHRRLVIPALGMMLSCLHSGTIGSKPAV